ncbi:SpoIIE family protein phosphatase [Streptomyces sp. MST-110588]|uniref:SpoIIE family protein phosphatase n=1 Tax=Streptomyces sp. MST-110588 TaxID=2833628 RepID=UPI001F5D810C|nr:SpoIIE family protein phosphatase [Streptomyces sp. MST-110588]UNO41087.1 SpoIIE family protein phosphatase [Streptomyces sp. MST-110588]
MDQTVTKAPTVQIRVDHDSAVRLAAAAARVVAVGCGLPGALPDHAAVLASELAGNLDKHAEDGTVYLQPLPLGGGMEILAVDRGPGMAEPERCLADGFTTTGTLGAGLGAVKRMATEFVLRSSVPGGTLACARLAPPGAPGAARQSVGSVCLPVEGEDRCGDACAVVETETGTGAVVRTAVIIDGLGHGDAAAEAAQAALRCFHAGPDRPLPDLFAAMNRALRRTRGAAVGVLRLTAGGRAEHCAVGNTRTVVLDHVDIRHKLAAQPGVVGWNMPVPQVEVLSLPPGATAVLHTDGIDHRWDRTGDPFLLRLPPPLLAAALAHGHRRVRDDATALTLRAPAAYRAPAAPRVPGRRRATDQGISDRGMSDREVPGQAAPGTPYAPYSPDGAYGRPGRSTARPGCE